MTRCDVTCAISLIFFILAFIQLRHFGKDISLKVKTSYSWLVDLVRIIIKSVLKCLRVLRQLFSSI